MNSGIERLEALCDRLKLEAQMHAQEARTANATIAEIYQLVTGATGEPGNWNGAEPVREYILKAHAVVKAAKAVLEASAGASDCIDNDGEPYQSQYAADKEQALREALAPFDAQPEASTTEAKK